MRQSATALVSVKRKLDMRAAADGSLRVLVDELLLVAYAVSWIPWCYTRHWSRTGPSSRRRPARSARVRRRDTGDEADGLT